MDRAICHAVRLLTFRELLNVLREVLLEIQFRIDTAPHTGEPLDISTSPSPSEVSEETESESSDADL